MPCFRLFSRIYFLRAYKIYLQSNKQMAYFELIPFLKK
jgi:hypothetical protein